MTIYRHSSEREYMVSCDPNHDSPSPPSDPTLITYKPGVTLPSLARGAVGPRYRIQGDIFQLRNNYPQTLCSRISVTLPTGSANFWVPHQKYTNFIFLLSQRSVYAVYATNDWISANDCGWVNFETRDLEWQTTDLTSSQNLLSVLYKDFADSTPSGFSGQLAIDYFDFLPRLLKHEVAHFRIVSGEIHIAAQKEQVTMRVGSPNRSPKHEDSQFDEWGGSVGFSLRFPINSIFMFRSYDINKVTSIYDKFLFTSDKHTHAKICVNLVFELSSKPFSSPYDPTLEPGHDSGVVNPLAADHNKIAVGEPL